MGEKEARTGANYRGRRISVNSRAVLRGGGNKERKEDGERERERDSASTKIAPISVPARRLIRPGYPWH